MQMERGSGSRLPTPSQRDPYSADQAPPPLNQPHPFSSPARQSLGRNLRDLSSFGVGSAAAPSQSRYYEQLQQQQQPQQQNYPGGRSGFYYNPQMQFNLPGNLPSSNLRPNLQPEQQFQAHQQYPQYLQQNLPYYNRQDSSFNPYPPPLYGREGEAPYWSPLEGDSSYPSSAPHHPQHSSSHGNAESFRFIRQINNNDVLCGRGGATNSHIGNRSFRLLVKQYKDKYLKAKKKEKPNVAGEIVDKIRGLDPPGRFLKKDRDTGYWLDIGDMRAKEKTSQALREGAPLIRKKLKEGAATTDEEGNTLETLSPEKSVANAAENAAEIEIPEAVDDGKRKVMSPVPPLDIKRDEGDEERSTPPYPKRKKGADTDNKSHGEKLKNDNDDDNASNVSAPSVQNSNAGSENPASPDSKQRATGSNDDDSLSSLTPTKRKMSKINERDLTKDERDLYLSVFDPPRALKQEEMKREEEPGEEKEEGKVEEKEKERVEEKEDDETEDPPES